MSDATRNDLTTMLHALCEDEHGAERPYADHPDYREKWKP